MNEKRVDWQPDARFEEGSFVAQVNKLPLRHPRYSFTLMMRIGDDRTTRFFPVRWKGQGKIDVVSIAADLQALVRKVEEHVQGKLQEVEDEKIDRMLRREQFELSKSKPRNLPGLKKLAKRDKAMRMFKKDEGDE